jgi:HK97 family phage portal protein
MTSLFKVLSTWLRHPVLALRETRPVQPHGGYFRFLRRTAAGIYVTPDQALRSDTVWACHRYLTQTVGQLPARVMRPRTDGSSGSDRVSLGGNIHPVDYVLNWRPNPELSPFQLRETMVSWAILYGAGYAEIERDLIGRIVALWPIEPWRVTPMRDTSGTLFYRIANGAGGHVDLAAMDIFVLRGYGHGPIGLSVIEYAAQTIGWQQATELFGATFFGEGMAFSGAISLQSRGTPDGLRRLREEIEEQHKGVARSNRWLFLDNGAKVEKMSATPEEAQFTGTLNYQVESICRWFGVPPQKAQHLLQTNYNSAEQLAIEVVVDSIAPWAIRFEEEATYKLFGGNRQNLFVKLDLKGLLRGDFATRQAGLQIQRQNGVISADDWCDLEDMPRVGPENGGDKHIVQSNMTPLATLGQPLPAPAPKPPEPGPLEGALGAMIDLVKKLNERDEQLEQLRNAAAALPVHSAVREQRRGLPQPSPKG